MSTGLFVHYHLQAKGDQMGDYIKTKITFDEWFKALGSSLQRAEGEAWRGPCPLCGSSRSFKLDRGEDGSALVYCFNCFPSARGAFNKLKETVFADASSQETGAKKSKKREATYQYPPDEILVRYEGKDFAWFHLENGKEVPGVTSTVPWQPYQAEKICETTKRIFIVEGEKDADTLNRLLGEGELAITSRNGSSSPHKTDWAPVVDSEAEIILIPDNDDAGEKYARHVRKILAPRTTKAINLPQNVKDASDFFDKGGKVEDLPRPVIHQSITNLSWPPLPEQRCEEPWLITDRDGSPILRRGIVAAISGAGATGKSRVVLDLICARACGDEDIVALNRWKVQQGHVLYIYGEDDSMSFHNRRHDWKAVRLIATGGIFENPIQKNISERLSLIKLSERLHYLVVQSECNKNEVQPGTLVDLIEMYLAHHPDTLVVIDPLVAVLGPGVEETNTVFREVVAILRQLLDNSPTATILLVHHISKASMSSNQNQGAYSARGGSTLIDGVRWHLSMRKTNKNDRTALTSNNPDLSPKDIETAKKLSIDKVNDGKPRDFFACFNKGVYDIVQSSPRKTREEASREKTHRNMERIVDILEKRAGASLNRSQIREQYKKEFAPSSISGERLNEVLRQMVEQNIIESDSSDITRRGNKFRLLDSGLRPL